MWATGMIHGVSTNYCSILQNALVFFTKAKTAAKNRKQNRNKTNRAHNYLQDFWKRFTIFNKAQYLQKNRKQEIKQSNLTWTYLEAHQGYQRT